MRHGMNVLLDFELNEVRERERERERERKKKRREREKHLISGCLVCSSLMSF